MTVGKLEWEGEASLWWIYPDIPSGTLSIHAVSLISVAAIHRELILTRVYQWIPFLVRCVETNCAGLEREEIHVFDKSEKVTQIEGV